MGTTWTCLRNGSGHRLLQAQTRGRFITLGEPSRPGATGYYPEDLQHPAKNTFIQTAETHVFFWGGALMTQMWTMFGSSRESRAWHETLKGNKTTQCSKRTPQVGVQRPKPYALMESQVGGLQWSTLCADRAPRGCAELTQTAACSSSHAGCREICGVEKAIPKQLAI